MFGAALVVEFLFAPLGLVPEERSAKIAEASIMLNYTTVLNIVFAALSALLVWRFLRTGGVKMLRMMNEPIPEHG